MFYKEMIAKIGFVILALLPILFYSINADVSIKEPLNWQASPNNNSTNMAWFQNSTQSIFAIIKTPDSGAFPIPACMN